MRYIVQMRRGNAEQWANTSVIPLEGELVVEIDEENNLHKLKIGDGVHKYSELAYLTAGDEIVTQVLAQALPRVLTVTLDVDKWQKVIDETDSQFGAYAQTLDISGVTQRSRLDLQPDATMLAEFKNLNLAFVTENRNTENGDRVIIAYSVGDMPNKTYDMQATVTETEVVADCDKIVGIPVGTPAPVSEKEQTDYTVIIYEDTTNTDVTKRYIFKQLGEEIGVIEIEELQEQQDAAEVQITISDDNVISASLVDGGISKSKLSQEIQDIIDNGMGSYEETDPTVPGWAKESTKPTYTAEEVGALPNTTPIPSSLADLNEDDKHRVVTDAEKEEWGTAYEHSTSEHAPSDAQVNKIELIKVNGMEQTIKEKVVDIAVPTKTSDLTNDSGFLTGYAETDPTVPDWAKATTKPAYTYAEITDKPDFADVATSGSYNDLSDTPPIPLALSDLSGDSDHRVVTDKEKETWNAKSDFSGSYNDLTDKPTIPSADLSNYVGDSISLQSNGGINLTSGNDDMHITVPASNAVEFNSSEGGGFIRINPEETMISVSHHLTIEDEDSGGTIELSDEGLHINTNGMVVHSSLTPMGKVGRILYLSDLINEIDDLIENHRLIHCVITDYGDSAVPNDHPVFLIEPSKIVYVGSGANARYYLNHTYTKSYISKSEISMSNWNITIYLSTPSNAYVSNIKFANYLYLWGNTEASVSGSATLNLTDDNCVFYII